MKKGVEMSLKGKEVEKLLRRIVAPLVEGVLGGDIWAWYSVMRTRDEAVGRVRRFPVEWEYIRRVIGVLDSEKRVIIEKARQMLMSWCLCGLMVRKAVIEPNATIGVISRREDEAKDLIERMKFILLNLPLEVLRRIPKWEKTALGLRFENGSRVIAFPSTEDVGRGYTFSLLVVDEAAFITNLKEIYEGLMPAVPEECQIVLCSTVGRAPVGLFYEIRSAPEEYGFKLVEIDWWEHPRRDKEWAERKKREIGADAFAREYERRWLAAGGVVFSELNEQEHRCGRYKPGQNDIVVFGLDPHPRKPSVGVWVAVTWEGTRYACYEVSLGERGHTLTVTEMAGRIYEVEREILGIRNHRLVYRVMDPSGGAQVSAVQRGWNILNEFARNGMAFSKAPRSPEARIEAIRRGLHGEGGKLYITESCPRLWQQLKDLTWRARDEADTKAELGSADFVDALGYALTFPISRGMFIRQVNERRYGWEKARRWRRSGWIG